MWEDLVSSAIVGPANKPLRLEGHSPALHDLLRQFDPGDAEGLLLGAAGAISIWRAAGVRLQQDYKVTYESCESDAASLLGPRTLHHLSLLLEGEYKELLPEFLIAAANTGKRVSPELLPALLGATCGDREKARLAAPLLGRRGEWLAQKQPEWRIAFLPLSEAIWETGNKAERTALLTEMRRTNAGRARELVASTWSADPSKDRAGFLSEFITGLGPDDEPFLDEALADKSVEVRRQATDLLSRLPGSRLSRDLAELAGSMLSLKKRLLAKGKIEVAFPDDAATKLKEKRIEFAPIPATGPFKSLGEKGRLLYQIVAGIPPRFWSNRFDVRPTEFIDASAAGDWDQALFSGLISAAGRRPDPDWNESLLNRYISRWEERSKLPPFPPEAFRALPNQRAEASIASAPKSLAGSADSPAIWLLGMYDRTWSESLARLVVQAANKYFSAIAINIGNLSQLLGTLKACAVHIPVAMADEVCSALSADLSDIRWLEKQAENLISLIRFRRDMVSAIKNEG